LFKLRIDIVMIYVLGIGLYYSKLNVLINRMGIYLCKKMCRNCFKFDCKYKKYLAFKIEKDANNICVNR
jgi:hypothetical protein